VNLLAQHIPLHILYTTAHTYTVCLHYLWIPGLHISHTHTVYLHTFTVLGLVGLDGTLHYILVTFALKRVSCG